MTIELGGEIRGRVGRVPTDIADLEAEGIDRIDHLVATHGHADHIGGHAAVIEWAETEGNGIGAAYDSGVPSDSATYERSLDAIEEYDVERFLVQEGDELPLGDANVTALVVNPQADPGDEVAEGLDEGFSASSV